MISRITEPKKTIPRKTRRRPGRCLEVAKACTDEMTPLRVRKVPKIERLKVRMISSMFQTFSMPFFSWIITECRNAVPVSQGISEAFSTGSQAQ